MERKGGGGPEKSCKVLQFFFFAFYHFVFSYTYKNIFFFLTSPRPRNKRLSRKGGVTVLDIEEEGRLGGATEFSFL